MDPGELSEHQIYIENRRRPVCWHIPSSQVAKFLLTNLYTGKYRDDRIYWLYIDVFHKI